MIPSQVLQQVESLIAGEPGCSSALSSRAGISVSYARQAAAELKNQKRIHISGWERGESGHLAAVFSAGSGKDADKPQHVKPKRKALSRFSLSSPIAARIVARLVRGEEVFSDDVAPMVFSVTAYVSNLLWWMHKKVGNVRISRWIRSSSGPAKPVFVLRTSDDLQPDAVPPRKLTQPERRKRLYKRLLKEHGRDIAETIYGAMFRGRPSGRIVANGRVIYEPGPLKNRKRSVHEMVSP